MKKIILFSLVFLTILSIGVCASEYPILDKQVETRIAHLQWTTTIQKTSMESTIGYIDEITGDSSQLSSSLNEFNSQCENMKSLTTHISLNNAIRQMIETTGKFRTETRKQINENNGKGLMALARIGTGLKNNKGGLDSLKDVYWNTRKTNELEVFDIRIERAQNVLDKLEENGYDITEVQAKLDEINEKKSEKESALDERNGLRMVSVNFEILALSKELHDVVRDLQIQIPRRIRLRHWINVGERVTERTNTIISELETLEIDVSELKNIHSKAETDLEKAKTEFEAGNIEESATALKDLKADFKELRETYKEIVFGEELEEDIEDKLESTSDAIDDTIEEMEEDV